MSGGKLRRTQSTESTSSVASTSSQRYSSNRQDASHEYATTATVTTSFGRHVSDICAILIHCPKHKKFALASAGQSRGLWLPYVHLKQSEGWYASAVNKLRSLFNLSIGTKSSRVFTPPEIMHVMRIQLPEVLKYVVRVVFMVNLLSVESTGPPSLANSGAYRSAEKSTDVASDKIPQSPGGSNQSRIDSKNGSKSASSSGSRSAAANGKKNQHDSKNHHAHSHIFHCFCDAKERINGLVWLTHDAIVNEEESFEIWGPEPAIFSSAFATNTVERGAHSEYTLREAVKYQARDAPRNHQEELLSSCHLERGDVLRLYSDYVQHCFPSQNMNFVSFRDYMTRLGYEDVKLPLHSGSSSLRSNQSSNNLQSKQSQQSTASANTIHQSSQQNQTNSNSSGNNHSSQVASSTGGLNGHDMHSLYRAFKSKRMPYVTFHELLLGLAAMDRNTVHGGRTGEMRCAYIFRYYDTDASGTLDQDELGAMAHDRLRMASMKKVAHTIKSSAAAAAAVAASSTFSDSTNNDQSASGSTQSQDTNSTPAGSEQSLSKSVSVSKSQSKKDIAAAAVAAASSIKIDQDSVKRELANIYKMLKLQPGGSIDELKFLLAVGTMQLRGTSLLFRSQVSVIPVKQYYDVIKERQALTDIEGNLVGGELHHRGTCPRCKEKHYKLTLHTVKLTQDAQVVEPTEVRFDEYPPPIGRMERQLSRVTFSSDTIPNKMIDMITNYWNSVAANQNQVMSSSGGISASVPLRMVYGLTNAVPLGKTQWERIDRSTLADYIKRLCHQAEGIFRQEQRVVPVTSPCYVLGDIHGNLTDLRIYERVLWPGAPVAVSGSYLFLGDYVDRGDFGLECICYLICMKILAPKTFYLLRGNHELRSIQQAFTFFREVCEKFRNQALGLQVWETLNKTFDYMPVAATIDDQIYCAHGGIPTSAIRLDELYQIPSPLQDPENQSPAAWEMLWNDPVSTTEYAEYADLLRKQPGGQQAVANMQGYLPNTKRGTAFFFSEEAVNRFLHINNLSYIIRAHECVPPGYALHCNGKVITIFSSSHYCGATNDAACILVEREKLRIIRIDTD